MSQIRRPGGPVAAVAAVAPVVMLLLPALLSAEPSVPSAERVRLVEAYGQVPLSFEQNTGQTDPQVAFLARGTGYALFLTPGEAVISLRQMSAGEPAPRGAIGREREAREATGPSSPPAVLRLRCRGANPSPRLSGLDPQESRSNYFIGNDRSRWRTEVPHFGKVRYEEVYPGIDLVYYGRQRQLEFDFVVKAGADPQRIGLEFEGADRIETDGAGALIVHVGESTVRQHKPVAYQERNGERQAVAAAYVVNDERGVSLRLAEYDRSLPLVIDPVLIYSTYLGGLGWDSGVSIAVDGSGNAYVTGEAGSFDFPTASPLHGAATLDDAFVTKFNASGSALVYSTYLGGNGYDSGYGIAVDDSGNAYVAGVTDSTDFPTANAAYGAHTRLLDAFVTKLNAAGSLLVYSTYLGGQDDDYARAVTVDDSGNACLVGNTYSADFPTAHALQGAKGGGFGWSDGFVTKLNAPGSALVYSTYLGGIGHDVASAVAADGLGNAYVTGWTNSSDFPTANALQGALVGIQDDAFVTKLNAAGSTIVYSTYLGGGDADAGLGIAVDGPGSAYLTGYTCSSDFPTAGALQGALAGQSDAFVAKLNAAGSALVYSTYLGGSNSAPAILEAGRAIAVDGSGNAYVAGDTFSIDFPVVDALQSANVGGRRDAFVAKLAAAGSALAYSTYLGAGDADTAGSIAVDGSGNAYVTGSTESPGFPTVSAFRSALAGSRDVFVAKIGTTSTMPTLAIGDATTAEGISGPTNALFAVTLSSAASSTVTVGFATADGTATAGSDYLASSGIVTFAPGATVQTIRVPVLADVAFEPAETFTVSLSGATTPVARLQGRGMILNTTPQILVEDCAAVEGDAGAVPCVFRVMLSRPSDTIVSVNYAAAPNTATAGSDYTAASGALGFAPLTVGPQDVSVPVIGDTAVETDETFFLNLTDASGATLPRPQATGTIMDDDAPSLSTAELSHGACQVSQLGPPSPGTDFLRLAQGARSSYEVVVDAITGEALPLTLERLAADNATVLAAASPVGTGTSLSLRWRNALPATVLNQHLRVSGGCSGSCTAGARYRLCFYDTTYSIARFNNSASQVTVLIVQNTTDAAVSGVLDFYASNGTLFHEQEFTLSAHGQTILNAASIPALVQRSGSITVAHDAPFGGLAGKAVSLEPATGFSFDSPLQLRP